MSKKVVLYLRCLALIVAPVFMGNSVFASHIFGVDLYYVWVSGNTYNIKMDVYGDCAAASLSSAFSSLYNANPEVEIKNGNNVINTITLNYTAIEGVEVTPVCQAEINNTTCNGGLNPGVRKFTYSNNVTLNGLSANWVFHFDGVMGNMSSAGRAASITNIFGNGTSLISLEAKLNNLTNPNSSSVFTTIPTPFFCINQPANFNPGAVDPNADSLSFALVPGLDGSGPQPVPVSYLSPFTATQPLAASSFSFNSLTGQLSFTPSQLQKSLVVYTVSEYKNGVLVGTSQREMTVVALTCNSIPPTGSISNVSAGSGVTIIDSTHLSACGTAGPFSFKISPADSTIADSISFAGIPTGAIDSVSKNGTKAAQGVFSWNTTGVAPGTYTFYVTFKSDDCPLSSTQTVAYSVLVKPIVTPSITIAVTDTNSIFCYGAPMHFAAIANTAGISYQWKNNGVPVGTNSAAYTNPAAAGSDVITCVFTSSAACVSVNPVTSNAIIPVLHSSTIPVVSITSSPVGTICSGAMLTFTASATDTATGAFYQWQKNGVSIAGATHKVYVNYTLAQGDTIRCVVNSNAPVCAIPGTSNPISLTVLPAPDTTVTTSGLIHICLGDSVILHSAGVGNIYQWQRNGVNIAGANTSTYTVKTTGNYQVYVANIYGCAVISSVVPATLEPVPYAPLANIGGFLNICTNDSLLLGTYSSFTQSLDYTWYLNGNVIAGATDPTYLTRVAGVYKVNVSDHACASMSPSLAVTTTQAPVDTLLIYAQTVLCPGSSGINITGGTPASHEKYIWYRNGVAIPQATAASYMALMEGTYTLKIADTATTCATYSQAVNIVAGISPAPVIKYEWPSFKTGAFSLYQWYYNGAAIAGAMGASYTPTQTGAYTVMVTDANGCTGTSANFYFAYSGVGNVSLNGGNVKVYPNPATDVIYITAPAAVNVALYAMDGRVVLTAAKTNQMDVSAIASGVYMLSITDENGAVIKNEKLVKK